MEIAEEASQMAGTTITRIPWDEQKKASEIVAVNLKYISESEIIKKCGERLMGAEDVIPSDYGVRTYEGDKIILLYLRNK